MKPQGLFRSAPLARAAAIALLLAGAACQAPESKAEVETSVKPGINQAYLDPALDVDAMVQRFEVESREICAQRDALVAAVGLRAGERLADIGAGTGLFLEPFAAAVGPTGKLYAVDIAAPFVQHLSERARAASLRQVEARLCSERSTDLPAQSIDAAFVCDTYHHFEYPRSTLLSIHRALVPGGRLVLVDFQRIEGVSSDWVLGHVRAGKEQVIAEIEAAGFRLDREIPVEGLVENYCLSFVRP